MIDNYFSNLPRDVTKKIIYDHLDEKSRYECSKVCKSFNDLIAKNSLKDAQIEINERIDPYFQFIEFNKEYCNYFSKKLLILPSIKDLSLSQAKNAIDKKLAENKYLIIKEIWLQFLSRFNSLKVSFEFVNYEISSYKLPNPNDEIKILLNAGLNKIESNIKYETLPLDLIVLQDWCTPETLKLLIKNDISFSLEFLFKVIENKNLHKCLPLIFNKIRPASKKLHSLLQSINQRIPDGEEYAKMYDLHLMLALDAKCSDLRIKKLLSRCFETNSVHISLALKNKFSDEIISDLLSFCASKIDASHISLALKNRYSENLILKLLNQTDEIITSEHFMLNLSHYSNNLIKRLLNGIDSTDEKAKFSFLKILSIANNDYFDEFFDLFMEKTRGSDQELVKNQFFIENDS